MNMNRILSRLLLLFVALCCAVSANAKIYVDITSPGLRKIPIAAPPLTAVPAGFEAESLGRKISDVLSNDLNFHGFFAVLDQREYGGRNDANWKSFGLDYVAKGGVYVSGQNMVVDYQLLDVLTDSVVLSRQYKTQTADFRRVAHQFCDEIVFYLTGEHGLSLSKIAFSVTEGRLKDIYSADFDGSGLRRETFERSLAISPRISPNGRQLVYTSYRHGKPQLYLKDLGVDNARQISAHPGLNISPSWSPDGRRIAVSLSKDGSPCIYLIDTAGNVLEKLTHGPGMDVSPTWSPDGTKLAFVSDRGGSPNIYVLDMVSRSVRRLTYSGSYNTDPQWSPKGNLIVYVARINGHFQICTISPEGGDPTQLTDGANNEAPVWSPDGRQILFISSRLGQKALFVMHSNGSNQRLLMRLHGEVTHVTWGPNENR